MARYKGSSTIAKRACNLDIDSELWRPGCGFSEHGVAKAQDLVTGKQGASCLNDTSNETSLLQHCAVLEIDARPDDW
jgi:hypothetical protein